MEPHDWHADDVRALELKLDKRPTNALSVRQWEILIGPDGNLLKGFLKHWEESIP